MFHVWTVFRRMKVDRSSSTTICHWGELKLGPGCFVRLTPRLLPCLNMCLSLETSKYYHRQYRISPYNILLHSIELR